MPGALYYRHLEKDKSQALLRTKGNFDASMSLSNPAKSELQWWIKNVVTAYNVINHPHPQHGRKLVSFRVETPHQLFQNVSYSFWPPDLC